MEKNKPHFVRLLLGLGVASSLIFLALALCIYPAAVVTGLLLDSTLTSTGHPEQLPDWFEPASTRHADWAEGYLRSGAAAKTNHWEVAATEWPMFGSVIYLVTAQELHGRGEIDARSGVIRQAVERSAEIVASLETATWVRTKWGEDYGELV